MWGRLREGVPPAVIAAHPPRLARVVEAAAAASASLAVIDTAPREGAAEAARLADLVMIPCRPSPEKRGVCRAHSYFWALPVFARATGP